MSWLGLRALALSGVNDVFVWAGCSAASDDSRGTCDAKSPGVGVVPGLDVLLPEAVGSVKTRPRPDDLPEKCCWETFETVYDAEGRPLLIAVDKFLCNPDYFRRLAERPQDNGLKWDFNSLRPNRKIDDPVEALKGGNGWPGARVYLKESPVVFSEVDALIIACMQPVVDTAWPGFKLNQVQERTHEIALLSPERQPEGKFVDAQRIPHTDAQPDRHGFVQPDGLVPPLLATVLPLTDKFGGSGTALWQLRRTARDGNESLSLLETEDQRHFGMGAYSKVHGRRHLYPELDLREEMPDPNPLKHLSNAWLDAIVVAHLRYNRLVLYDGRRLHNQYADDDALSRLSLDPAKGRLTLSSAYFHSVDSMSAHGYTGPQRVVKRTKYKTAAETVSEIAGVDVPLPAAVSKITSTRRVTAHSPVCCWQSFETLYDDGGKPIFVVVDNFLCMPEVMVKLAAEGSGDMGTWQKSKIKPNINVSNSKEQILQGEGFPGRVLPVSLSSNEGSQVDMAVTMCLQPLVDALWPGFKLKKSADRHQAFQLMSNQYQLKRRWLDSQRLPRTSIRPELGLRPPNQAVPHSFVSLMGLTAAFDDTGIGAWRVKQTARNSSETLSLLETQAENEAVMGVFGRGAKSQAFPELNVRREIPDPAPHHKLSHAWAEAIAVARLRYNRVVLMDGRRLQQDYLEPDAYDRLRVSPSKGRLTLSSSYWFSPKEVERVARKKKGRASGRSAT